MDNRFKFDIFYTISGVQKTSRVYPIFDDISLTKDLAQYRDDVKCTSNFTFINRASDSIFDYDIIKQIEVEDIFQKVTLRVSERINGSWKYAKTLFFSVVDASIDDDRCTATVTMLFEDIYACLLNKWDKEYNILKEVPKSYDYDIDNPVNLELFTSKSTFKTGILWDYDYVNHVYFVWLIDPFGTIVFDGGLFYDHLGYGDGFPTDNTYGQHPAYLFSQIFSTENFFTTNYPYQTGMPWISNIQQQLMKWRIYKNDFKIISNLGNGVYECEVETTWCCETTFTANDDQGNMVAPSGGQGTVYNGWIPFTNISVSGIAGVYWAREAFWTKYDEFYNDPAYNSGEYAYTYFKSGGGNVLNFKLKNPYTLLDASNLKIRRGRALVTTIQTLLDKTECGLKLYSQFLNYDGTIINNTGIGSINPVVTPNHIGETNPVYWLNKCRDIKYPLNTDLPATELFLSLSSLIQEISIIFNCAWYIKDNYFIFEHLSFFENNYSYNYPNNAPTIDLTGRIDTQTGKREIISTSKYKYNTDEIYDKETWSMQQYLDYDFAKLSIDYNIQLNSGNKEKQNSISIITDVAGVISEPAKFSDESIVMVATTWQNGTLTSVNEQGYRTNKDVTNGYLCLSNLFDRFYRHGRVLLKGQLDAKTDESGNVINEQFESAIYKKLQDIEVRDCDESLFDNNNLVKTDLGTGRVYNSEHKMKKKTTRLTIAI